MSFTMRKLELPAIVAVTLPSEGHSPDNVFVGLPLPKTLNESTDDETSTTWLMVGCATVISCHDRAFPGPFCREGPFVCTFDQFVLRISVNAAGLANPESASFRILPDCESRRSAAATHGWL